MKIMGNYYTAQIDKRAVNKTEKAEKASFKSQIQSADSLTISASKEKVAELHFIGSLKSQIVNEINTSTPVAELDALAAQIEKGTYQIDASEIAKSILLSN